MRLVNKSLELRFGEATVQRIEERNQGAAATRWTSVWFSDCAAFAWGEYLGDMERAIGIEPTSAAWEARHDPLRFNGLPMISALQWAALQIHFYREKRSIRSNCGVRSGP